MKNVFALALIVAFAVSPLAAQRTQSTPTKNSGASQKGGVPMSSPEPITMIALAGGAAAAGGLASRRRKNK